MHTGSQGRSDGSMCWETPSNSLPAFWILKMQTGPQIGALPFPSHDYNFSSRNANSRQQKPQHTIIMVDSVHEVWMPPSNFLFFCLQIKQGSLVDSIQLLPVL